MTRARPIDDALLSALIAQQAAPAASDGPDKVVPLAEAVQRLVRPGASLYFGFGHARAHAAAFEIARRFKGTTPGFHLITAGLLEFGLVLLEGGLLAKVTAAYAGNTYPMVSPNRLVRDAEAAGRIAIAESTNLTIATRLMAGALGLPFIPTRSITGTDLARPENGYATVADPFGGAATGVLAALNPDLAILHAYAADPSGNALLLAPYGEDNWGAMASRGGVLLTVEKLVSTDFIRRHAHLVRLPASVVRSVSVAPFGAHPQPMTVFGLTGEQGYADDYAFRRDFLEASRDPQRLAVWLDQWVYGPTDHADYVRRLGDDRLDRLRAGLAEDAWRPRLADALGSIARDPAPNASEILILLAAREIERTVKAKGYRTILAGAGIANLAAWLAVDRLKGAGVDIELMAEAGFYGYRPRYGDPYVFSVANMFTNKMHSGFIGVLGTLAGSAESRCLAVIGAGQIDRLGNINSTRQADGRFLVGSGGANDLGNGAQEILVLCPASPQRLVPAVSYVTTSGRNTRTLVTHLGVLEKQGEGLVPVRLAPGASATRAARADAFAAACGWPIDGQAAGDEHAPIEPAELAALRLYDPERIFID
ncbi:MAG: glutaconate CoA-transferase [Rhodospirillales bacterium]|nr:glutaconate CoA-transferase [Rhodospirillales bacterium]